MDQGEVLLLDAAPRELAHQRPVRLVVLGYHEQPRGAAVEAVDDPGPQHAADAREVVHPGEQRVHERAARGAGRGVDHEAGGLVHDQQRSVLVHHPKRDVLGLRLGRCRQQARSRPPSGPPSRAPRRGRARRRAGRALLRSAPGDASGTEPGAFGRARRRGAGRPRPVRRPAGGPLPPQAAAIPWLRLTRGSSSAAPKSSTSAMSCEVETTPPSQEPRSGSPRRNSSANRAAE